MLFELVNLSDQINALNVFRYITFRTGGAIMTALLFVFLFGPAIIDVLRIKQGKGQPIREDGPQTHFAKRGTPTMGGLMILSGITVATLLWANLGNPYVWTVLFVTLSFGAIGFYDDYLKVSNGKSSGFAGRWRLLTEILVAGIAAFAVMHIGSSDFSSSLAVPFFKTVIIPLGAFFVLLGVLVIVGAGNAVNLTDGLDGLAIVPVMIASASFGLIAYLVGNAVFADYLQIHYVPGTGELAVLCGAVIGAGLGFRAVARQALAFVPGVGWAVKGGIAYAGTRALGKAAATYFEKGGQRGLKQAAGSVRRRS
jgi:phospho-N-acetylmuramoyl-pentapeptide-transferase